MNHSIHIAGASHRRELLLAAYLALSALARADILETPEWALLGTATGKAGYDSNLTYNRDGRGDAFGTAEADLRLDRLNSVALTDLAATVAETGFLDHRAPSQTDATAAFDLTYPHVEDALPQLVVDLGWSRTTAADPEVNRRLTLEKTSGSVSGRVLTSGQFGVDAGVDSALYDYSADDLGRNYQTDVRGGIAYDPSPLTEISANVLAGSGGFSGNPETGSVRDHTETATLQVQGQIVPKVTSTLYAGVTHVSYDGGYTNTSTLPTSGGQLVWEISPGRTLKGGVSLTTGFAPDGDTQRKAQATLDYTQPLAEEWSADLTVADTHYSDRSVGFVRTDSGVSGGIAIRNAPSRRFDLSLGFRVLHQTSNLVQAGFDDYLTTLQINFHI